MLRQTKTIVNSTLNSVLSYTVLTLVAIVIFTPILFMLVGSFKPDANILIEAGGIKAFWPDQLTLQNYFDVFARVTFLKYLFNSLLITSSIVLLGIACNSLIGYAFARLEWRGRNLLLSLVVAVMIIPLEAIAVPLFYQISVLGWRDTYVVQILPFIANAFSIYLFYTFFLSLPKELEEAAVIDGASRFVTFLVIIVPNSKPVFATVAILTFLTQWGAYLWPLMVTSSEQVRPLPLGIATFFTLPPLQWGDIFAFGVMMVSPVIILFIVFQRWFVQSVTSSSVKG